MAPYFYLIIIVAILLLLDSKYFPQKGYLSILAMIVVLLFSGFRDKIGYDYDNYHGYFLFPDDAGSDLEFGFMFLLKTIKALGLDEQTFFFVFSFITIVFIFYAYKNLSDHYRLSFFIYLLIPGLFLSSLTTIRQAAAMGLMFYSYIYISQKKYLQFIILFFIAFSIHSTAIIVAMVYVLSLFNWTKNIIKISLVVLPISLFIGYVVDLHIILFGAFSSENRYSAYGYLSYSVNVLKIALSNFVFLIYLLVYNKRMNEKEEKMLSLTFFGVLIMDLFPDAVVMTRLSAYFYLFEAIVASGVMYKGEKTVDKMVIAFIVMCYFMFLFYNSFSVAEVGDGMIPYKSVLF